MKNDRKQKLMDLGSEVLSEKLLELTAVSEAAEALVERLTSDPEENVQRVRKKLSGLKRLTRFIDWRGVSEFAQRLQALLEELKAGVTDPSLGVELVVAFYETDKTTLGNCDDSTGEVGDVFRYSAKELFTTYAARCSDKQKIAHLILKLNREDDYGVRDSLVECAGDFLPEGVIREMISELQVLAEKAGEEFTRRHHLILVELLARQIKDAQLFEKTRIASWGKLNAAGITDIARVYLESGDVGTAHAWLKKIPENESFIARDRDQLLVEIYRQQGDQQKLLALIYRKFRSNRCTDTLDQVLELLGEEKRAEVLLEETHLILKDPNLKVSDAVFLASVGNFNAAAEYLITRAEHIDGTDYWDLPPLADVMASEHKPLAATLIYRALLVSLLERAYTKAYPHGVRYLKKLDGLAGSVLDWKNNEEHEAFKDRIVQAHGRKRSFWAKYGPKK